MIWMLTQFTLLRLFILSFTVKTPVLFKSSALFAANGKQSVTLKIMTLFCFFFHVFVQCTISSPASLSLLRCWYSLKWTCTWLFILHRWYVRCAVTVESLHIKFGRHTEGCKMSKQPLTNIGRRQVNHVVPRMTWLKNSWTFAIFAEN